MTLAPACEKLKARVFREQQPGRAFNLVYDLPSTVVIIRRRKMTSDRIS